MRSRCSQSSGVGNVRDRTKSTVPLQSRWPYSLLEFRRHAYARMGQTGLRTKFSPDIIAFISLQTRWKWTGFKWTRKRVPTMRTGACRLQLPHALWETACTQIHYSFVLLGWVKNIDEHSWLNNTHKDAPVSSLASRYTDCARPITFKIVFTVNAFNIREKRSFSPQKGSRQCIWNLKSIHTDTQILH
jgi:hypothetical protein